MNKKYLIEIPHPHFVHFFKNIIKMLGEENVYISCQDSGIISELLNENHFIYHIVGKKYRTITGKAIGQLKYLLHYMKAISKHRIRVVFGLSPSMGLAAKLTRRKMIVFDDDDSAVQPLSKLFTIPFANLIVTPKCLEFEKYGKKHRVYRGYQELAYLSPDYFTPDPSVIHQYGLREKTYFILRFNDFLAHHDLGHKGIPEKIKYELVNVLKNHGQIYITSESPLSADFSQYQLKVKPNDIHHILAFARMYIGDSQTMASEAAVLGTPSIRCNTFKNKIAYLTELEQVYGLTYAFLPSESDEMMNKISSIIENPDNEKEWVAKKNHMLSQCEDVNKFILSLLSQIDIASFRKD
jgi:uncharacterized protein